MCDDDECPKIIPGEITPTPLPEQAGGGVVIVSTLPNIDDAREGIIYLYLTDESDASTFSGAYVADKKAGQMINISEEGEDGHIYTFENTASGFKAFQDGVEIYEYTAPAFTGTDGQTAGTAGLVPAPAVADDGKYLKADGTWDAIATSSGAKVLTSADNNWNSTAHNSTTEPFDAIALWLLPNGVYIDDYNRYDSSLKIYMADGNSAQSGNDSSIYLVTDSGTSSSPNRIVTQVNKDDIRQYRPARQFNDLQMLTTFAKKKDIFYTDNSNASDWARPQIGAQSKASGTRAIAIGTSASATAKGSVAIGAYSSSSTVGVMNIGTSDTGHGYSTSNYRLLTGLYDGQSAHDAATVGQLSYRQKKPAVIWEVDGEVVTTGLVGVGEDISANPNWQLTGLDLTPFARIKIYSKAAQKAGTTASASTTPAMVLEMSLDDRAAIAEYGGNYVGSIIAQKPNDANRLCTLTCAVSADKTKFEVLRMTNLYGTAATSNSDVNAYVFKIEGYYD